MATVVLISCVSKKLRRKAPADELYTSDLFKKNLAYAKSLRPKAIYILSAKHGLLALTTPVAPYNQTLNTMPMHKVEAWAARVRKQLQGKVAPRDTVVFLAGARYRKFLLPHFANTKVPMQGLGIGKQLAFLKHATKNKK